MTKVIDMDRVVDGDKTSLNGTGVNQSETSTEVEAKDLPEGTMMEITQPGTDKKFILPALSLAGGDYHKVIRATDDTIPEEDIKTYYDIFTKMDWQDGRINFGNILHTKWVQEIWDKVDPEGVEVIDHYLNFNDSKGLSSNHSSKVDLDSWEGNEYTVIVYLTPDWTPDDGGSIEFWTPNLSDKMRAMAINTPYGFSGSEQPNIVKSYWPKSGRVVVFDARIPYVERAIEGDKMKVSLVFKCRKLN